MKKKSHFFELYINRILKQISDKKSLTLNAKQQLNSFICIFINKICSHISKLLEFVGRKICSVKEVASVLHFFLRGKLLDNCRNQGQKAVESYATFDKKVKNVSKNAKANIILPPPLIEKFFKSNNIMLSQTSPAAVYLAAVVEYILYEIIDLSVINCNENQRTRITVRDMDLVVKNDVELTYLFTTLNTSFLINSLNTSSIDNVLIYLNNISNWVSPDTISLFSQSGCFYNHVDGYGYSSYTGLTGQGWTVIVDDCPVSTPNYTPTNTATTTKTPTPTPTNTPTNTLTPTNTPSRTH